MKLLAIIFFFIGLVCLFMAFHLVKEIILNFNKNLLSLSNGDKFLSLNKKIDQVIKENQNMGQNINKIEEKIQNLNRNIKNIEPKLNAPTKQPSHSSQTPDHLIHKSFANTVPTSSRVENLTPGKPPIVEKNSSESRHFDETMKNTLSREAQVDENFLDNIEHKITKINIKTMIEYINEQKNTEINHYTEKFADVVIRDEKRGYYLIQFEDHGKRTHYLLCNIVQDYEKVHKLFQKNNHGKDNVIVRLLNPATIELPPDDFQKMKRENKINMELIYNTNYQLGLVEVE
jgi:hypothetical protein